jgi:hypothetical protein
MVYFTLLFFIKIVGFTRQMAFIMTIRFLFTFLFLSSVYAAEVDQHTNSHITIDDSQEILNNKVNDLIRLSIKQANAPRYSKMPKHPGKGYAYYPLCSVDLLHKALESNLARALIGQIEMYAEESPLITKRTLPIQQSIYRDFSAVNAPSLATYKRISSVINLNGIEIGTDKLGHFFTEGWRYFQLTNQMEGDIKKGILFGLWTESFYYGAQAPGVFSYADMIANFNGLRFWNRVRSKFKDPITHLYQPPYITCENKKWAVNNSFLWSEYVDEAWNESVNCNNFKTQGLLNQINYYDTLCDVEKLPKKYDHLPYIKLNRVGLEVMNDSLQFEKFINPDDLILNKIGEHNLNQIRIYFEEW